MRSSSRTLLQFRSSVSIASLKTLAFAMPAPFHLPDDIVSDILIRLPARSIGRFRCVCKRWLSLASDPEFILTHASHAPITGFFFARSSHHLFLNPQPYSLALPSNFYVESSCNGLILIADDGRSNFAVYNPTTAKSWPIPPPPNGYRWNLTLAFDPSRSPHFKIVKQGTYIYSSETRTWKHLLASHAYSVHKGVFWNGHVVWDTQNSILTCFDVEAEQFRRVSFPWNKSTSLYPHYIGESRGSLHLVGGVDYFVEINRHLDIWDLKYDLSGWSVLCSVDMGEISGIPKEVYYEMSILYFHRGGGGGGDQLLLNICGKITAFHLQDKTCLSLCDGVVTGCRWWYNIFLLAETLLSL